MYSCPHEDVLFLDRWWGNRYNFLLLNDGSRARGPEGASYYQRAMSRLGQKNDQIHFSLSGLMDYFTQSNPTLQTLTDDTLYYDQHLNHADAEDMRTFKQRYWVDGSQARGFDSPVLFYICGEATCSARDAGQVVLNNAKALGAYVVTLEHRYYGESQPFPTLTTENLQYLTVANALGDLSEFERFIQKSMGLTGKWIAIGGSYPGALSAFYRATHPDLVVGSLASSAPVQARDNFEDYDRHVTEVAGPDCANLMRKAIAQAEAATGSDDTLTPVKALFDAEKITDSDDFLYLIADVGAAAVQYGMRDEFCQSLTNASTSSDPSAILAAYGQFAQKVYDLFQVDAWGFSFESAQNTDPSSYIDGVGQRQWLYQSCTEFGFFQNAYHDPAYSVRSARINPEFHRRLCQRIFGIDQPVNTDEINQNYLKPILQTASNILFTNGSQDPWSLLSIEPGSDLAAQNPNLQTDLIDQASHCSDISRPRSDDSASLLQARQLFSTLVMGWLGLN